MRAAVQDRVVAGVGTVLVVALLGLALVLGLTVDLRTATQHALAVFDVRPPATPPPPIERRRVKPRAAGRAAPRNLRNKATAVVAPPPIVTPPPPPIVTAARAGPGAAAETGASDRPGPGQGAGGRGNGDGGGGAGDGDGDDTPPEQVGGRLKPSDMPLELAAPGADYTVWVRYHVEIDGRVGDCTVTRSSGSALLDTRVCQLIRQRFRFRPSRDPDGRPVRSTIVEYQSFGVDRGDHPADAK